MFFCSEITHTHKPLCFSLSPPLPLLLFSFSPHPRPRPRGCPFVYYPSCILSRVQVHLFQLTTMKEKRSSATNSYKSWLSFKSHLTDASEHKSSERANATVSPVKSTVFSTSSRFLDDDEYERPTVEEESTLRRVSGKVPWVAYTIAFVELCERFSFFGTAAVCESSSPRNSVLGSNYCSSCQLHPAASA